MIKLVNIVEASTVTGPAKNIINFCRTARDRNSIPADLPLVDTSIATFDRASGGAQPNQFVAAARDAGIEVDVIGERFRFDPKVIAGLRGVIAGRAPHIVETHSVKSHFLMRLSGAARAHAWIAFHHGYTATDLKMRAYNKLDRWSLGGAHIVITVSRSFARALAREGVRPDRIRVLHNSIDAERDRLVSREESSRLRARLGIGSERVILSVGRLSQEKGHADLVSALGSLRSARSEIEFKLVIVGDGPERRRIEQAAARLGLDKQIIFAGQQSDVRPYYAMADLLALPSHSEGSPNVLLEAMAASLPVVATSVGGVPEIVAHNESALLVRAGDPRAMAEALAALLTDAERARRLAEAAHSAVKARHSPEARLRALIEIYCELAPDLVPSKAQAV